MDNAPALPRQNPEPAAEVVLDTNVALDWLVFDDAAMRPLGAQIERGAWRWVLSPAMREEFLDVLARPTLALRVADLPTLLHRFASLAHLVDEPGRGNPAGLVCADPDDQAFIDLALARSVPLLLSRDKALLALAGRARQFGVRVLTPAALACDPRS